MGSNYIVTTLDERRRPLAQFSSRLEAECFARDRARVDVAVEPICDRCEQRGSDCDCEPVGDFTSGRRA